MNPGKSKKSCMVFTVYICCIDYMDKMLDLLVNDHAVENENGQVGNQFNDEKLHPKNVDVNVGTVQA